MFQVVVAHKLPDGQIEFLSINAHNLTQRKQAERERYQMEILLRHAQKLESIGQLAAGIAHEINTPTQFIGDNLRFVQDVTKDLFGLLNQHQPALAGAARSNNLPTVWPKEIEKTVQTIDLPDLEEEVPKADCPGSVRGRAGLRKSCRR